MFVFHVVCVCMCASKTHQSPSLYFNVTTTKFQSYRENERLDEELFRVEDLCVKDGSAESGCFWRACGDV